MKKFIIVIAVLFVYQISFGQENEGIRDRAMIEYNNQNYAKAIQLWERAANQGDAHSQYILGLCYYLGDIVQQSDQTAVEWFRKAANQGHTVAQYNLGVCYEFGEGVPKSYPVAIEWYEMAAKDDYTPAKVALKRLHAQ